MFLGMWEVWLDGDKVLRIVSGILDEFLDGDRVEIENVGECNLFLDIFD